MPRLNWPVFLTELRAKETAAGLMLLVPGVSWGDPRYVDAGLDPLPADLTPEQVKAINEVVAAHDPTKPDPVAVNVALQAQIDALEKGSWRTLREAMLGTVGAMDRLTAIDTQVVALRAQRIP